MLVNLGPVALFSNFRVTTSSGKHLEDISHAHIVSLMYKLNRISSKDADDLSIGFDRSHDRRKQELTNTKNVKGKTHLRIMLKDTFGFAEYQEKSTYGLGYKLPETRNKDDAVIDKAASIADARIKIGEIHWYVPHYTPSIQQQGFLSEIFYVRQLLSPDKLNSLFSWRKFQNLWNFELGSQESMNVPIWIIIGFQQKDRQDCQNLISDTFCRLPIVSAQCNIGTEKYPDAGIILVYDDDDYSQAYTQIKEAFRALTKDDILQSYISDHDFRYSILRADDVGCIIYVVDKQ